MSAELWAELDNGTAEAFPLTSTVFFTWVENPNSRSGRWAVLDEETGDCLGRGNADDLAVAEDLANNALTAALRA